MKIFIIKSLSDKPEESGKYADDAAERQHEQQHDNAPRSRQTKQLALPKSHDSRRWEIVAGQHRHSRPNGKHVQRCTWCTGKDLSREYKVFGWSDVISFVLLKWTFVAAFILFISQSITSVNHLKHIDYLGWFSDIAKEFWQQSHTG